MLYKNEAPHVENLLQRQGYTVCVLHGNISQDARLKALNDFKTGKVGVLIATDVAARGLDIPNVGTVINYTFPLTVEDYVHRIGRTGTCTSLVSEEDLVLIRAMQVVEAVKGGVLLSSLERNTKRLSRES